MRSTSITLEEQIEYLKIVESSLGFFQAFMLRTAAVYPKDPFKILSATQKLSEAVESFYGHMGAAYSIANLLIRSLLRNFREPFWSPFGT